jgi:hypothetical protein
VMVTRWTYLRAAWNMLHAAFATGRRVGLRSGILDYGLAVRLHAIGIAVYCLKRAVLG